MMRSKLLRIKELASSEPSPLWAMSEVVDVKTQRQNRMCIDLVVPGKSKKSQVMFSWLLPSKHPDGEDFV